MSFQVEIINIFLKSASDVLKQEVQADMKRGPIAMTMGKFPSDEITSVIALTGDIQGQVFYSMDNETAKKLISKMLYEEVRINDPKIQDGIAEMGNVITGNASIQLSQKGYECDISPPTIVKGKGLEISNFGIKTIKIPLKTQYGIVTMRIGVKKK